MRITNKRAYHEYTILETTEAGVALFGWEVKSLHNGHASLEGSFVKLMGGEAYVVNAQIFPYKYARADESDPARSRKLLLHKRELLRLQHKLDSDGLTLVPVAWYTKGPRLKLEIALAKGKKQFEKREILKKRAQKRELERDFRGKVK